MTSSEQDGVADRVARDVLDNLAEGCQVIGFDWTYLYVNDSLVTHAGQSREQLLGRTMMDRYPGIEGTAMFPELRRCMSERVHHRMENEFTFPDGSVGWFELRFVPVPEGTCILSLDITKRKGVEETLRQSQEELATTLSSIGDAVIVTDLAGSVVRMNPSAERLTGWSAAEAVGRKLEDVFCILNEETRAPMESPVQRVLRDGIIVGLANHTVLVARDGTQAPILRAAMDAVLTTRKATAIEVAMPRPDDTPVWFSSHFGPVRRDAEIVGAIIVARDVTEKKRTEAQLMVSDGMASVGTLAAGVAHEINNPLTAVMANLDLALRDAEAIAERLGPGEVGELQEELRDARDAAERVRQIVRDLKIFSRAGEQETRGPVDVRRVLESTLRMGWNEIHHRARLVQEHGKIPPVEANESRLGQVFLNLIVNAAQAIEEGNAEGNEIRVVTSVGPTGLVHVEIRDTGSGMPPEVLRRLFTPFFTTKAVGVGAGLGLSICHRIVTDLGGEIRVESQVGRGTTFRVLLRPALLEAVESPLAFAPPQRAIRRGRILVIDDEPMIGAAVRRTLARAHDVTVAQRAEEALGLVAAGSRFDVILCDLMMPQMTGMDFYEKLRSTVAEQASRIIFITGGAFTQRAREFLDKVPNLRIEKPFDTAQLRSLVNDGIR